MRYAVTIDIIIPPETNPKHYGPLCDDIEPHKRAEFLAAEMVASYR